ncbi:MAG: DUF4443 domain-containing protein [Candidatus Bathyarchaeia archaeon]
MRYTELRRMGLFELETLRIIEKVASNMAPGPSLTFMEAHVFKALELMADRGFIGRSKLSSELGIGEGAVRTLIKHLRKWRLVEVSRAGCHLTGHGKRMFAPLKDMILGEVEIPKNPVTVGNYNRAVQVGNASDGLRYGLEQRDAAVKAGALGATTLIFSKGRFIMPPTDEDCFKDSPEIGNLLRVELKPREGDVIIIGSSNDAKSAELGAKAALLATIKMMRR